MRRRRGFARSGGGGSRQGRGGVGIVVPGVLSDFRAQEPDHAVDVPVVVQESLGRPGAVALEVRADVGGGDDAVARAHVGNGGPSIAGGGAVPEIDEELALTLFLVERYVAGAEAVAEVEVDGRFAGRGSEDLLRVMVAVERETRHGAFWADVGFEQLEQVAPALRGEGVLEKDAAFVAMQGEVGGAAVGECGHGRAGERKRSVRGETGQGGGAVRAVGLGIVGVEGDVHQAGLRRAVGGIAAKRLPLLGEARSAR